MIPPEEGIRRLVRAGALLVGLDFDGVLAEIAARPELARPVDGVRGVLDALVTDPTIRVAAVSGRRRADLDERLRPPGGVLLVGEHGADFGDGEIPPPARYGEVRAALEAIAAAFDGAWVEEKRTGLTIHGRALSPEDADELASRTEEALADIVPGRFERGNRVVDVRLTGSTKGAAVLALRRPGESVLYVGDDTTDETVFEILGTHDLGVKVGPGATAASCRLPDPPAVVGFLRALLEARAASGGGDSPA